MAIDTPTRCLVCGRASFLREETGVPGEHCQIGALAKGDYLFKEGDVPKSTFLIKKGSFRFVRKGPDGGRHIIKLAFEGEIVGYPELLGEDRYAVSAEARELSHICEWDGAHFAKRVTQEPELSAKVMGMLSTDLRRTRLALIDLASQPAEQRLYRYVMDLATHNGALPLPAQLPKVPRKEAAELTGLTPETVSRLLKQWKTKRFVMLEGKKVPLKGIQNL